MTPMIAESTGQSLLPSARRARRAADDDHLFVKAGADRVDRDDIAALVSAVEVDRLYDEQLFAVQAFVFLRGNDGA